MCVSTYLLANYFTACAKKDSISWYWESEKNRGFVGKNPHRINKHLAVASRHRALFYFFCPISRDLNLRLQRFLLSTEHRDIVSTAFSIDTSAFYATGKNTSVWFIPASDKSDGLNKGPCPAMHSRKTGACV